MICLRKIKHLESDLFTLFGKQTLFCIQLLGQIQSDRYNRPKPCVRRPYPLLLTYFPGKLIWVEVPTEGANS